MLNLKDKFSKRIDELSETSAAYLVSGSCADHTEYKMMVGKLAGLQQAKQEFQEIWDKFVHQQEED
jgi:hypothetical protein